MQVKQVQVAAGNPPFLFYRQCDVKGELRMTQVHLSAVMDVSPWPQGHGFAGARVWWDYVLSKEERKRLDHLMGMALLDSTVRDRLVYERDDSLLAAFGLSEETREWLRSIHAASLTELAEAVVSGLQNIPSPLDIKPGC